MVTYIYIVVSSEFGRAAVLCYFVKMYFLWWLWLWLWLWLLWWWLLLLLLLLLLLDIRRLVASCDCATSILCCLRSLFLGSSWLSLIQNQGLTITAMVATTTMADTTAAVCTYLLNIAMGATITAVTRAMAITMVEVMVAAMDTLAPAQACERRWLKDWRRERNNLGLRNRFIWDAVKISVDYFSKGGSSCVERVHQTM